MKTRKRVFYAEREEGGDSAERRISLRKRSRTKYASIEESDDDLDAVIVVDDINSSEEVQHSWPVTCGNKKGLLHTELLEKGQDCIESEGRWFSPGAFEQFGGKGTSRKWKSSIFFNNYPLQYWIDCGDLNPSPFKKRQSTASETSHNKKNHPEEAAENDTTGDEEGPAETEEAQTAVQNEERKTPSIKLKRIPMLILHKLEHLEGDFHQLLNSVVLQQKGGSVPREEATEEEAEDRLGTEESGEPHEATLLQNNLSENEEEDVYKIQDTLKPELSRDVAVQKNAILVPSKLLTEEELGEEAKNNLEAEESCVPQNSDSENEVKVTEDAPSAAEEPNVELEDAIPDIGMILTLENEQEEDIEDRLDTEESIEPQEEMLPQNNNCQNEGESMHIADMSSAEAANASELQITEVKEESQEADMSSPQNNTIDEVQTEAVEIPTTQHNSSERPLQQDSPRTMMHGQATTAETSADLDDMDLEQLKREKLKIQIKVLKLQEKYYSLQLKRLNQ